jgi:hypothetical protein
MARNMKTAGLFIDMRDPQCLAVRVLFGHATGEEPARGREAVELQREFGTLIPHVSLLFREGGSGDPGWVHFRENLSS